jgi:hypothetical protein
MAEKDEEKAQSCDSALSPVVLVFVVRAGSGPMFVTRKRRVCFEELLRSRHQLTHALASLDRP